MKGKFNSLWSERLNMDPRAEDLGEFFFNIEMNTNY